MRQHAKTERVSEELVLNPTDKPQNLPIYKKGSFQGTFLKTLKYKLLYRLILEQLIKMYSTDSSNTFICTASSVSNVLTCLILFLSGPSEYDI